MDKQALMAACPPDCHDDCEQCLAVGMAPQDLIDIINRYGPKGLAAIKLLGEFLKAGQYDALSIILLVRSVLEMFTKE